MTDAASETTPARRAAAAALTAALESRSRFSFLRLGDGEVQWLLQARAGQASSRYRYEDTASIEVVRGVTGMEARHEARFVAALNGCDYLDRCDSIPAVARHQQALGIARPVGALGNASPETSNIIFEWAAFELGGYLARHRCLIAGAEAPLWQELWPEPAYRACAAGLLDFSAPPLFHRVRENGRRYSENLDLIKEDLRAAIRAHRADTLFLSLATGAKILCHELAQEENIRAVDFGSMLRALTYAGSSGYQSHRDMHNPFLFHVPFGVHLAAVERAYPELTPLELAGKACAQLAHELHPHRRFRFNTSDGVAGGTLDLSAANRRQFRAAERVYRRDFWPRYRGHAGVEALDREFRRWLDKHGIGWRGFWFLRLAAAKRRLRTAGLLK